MFFTDIYICSCQTTLIWFLVFHNTQDPKAMPERLVHYSLFTHYFNDIKYFQKSQNQSLVPELASYNKLLFSLLLQAVAIAS